MEIEKTVHSLPGCACDSQSTEPHHMNHSVQKTNIYRPIYPLLIFPPPPSTKNGIIRTLLHRSKTICLDPESQNNEVSHLTSVFQQNWYPSHFIHEALRQRSTPEQPGPRATISIPYVKGISEKIKRICAKERIHVYFSSSRTTGSLLSRVRSCTDPNDTTGVVYCIPCQDCDHSYVDETGCTLKTRLSEHCRNGDVERSGMAQHTIEEDHRIDWEGSTQ